MNKQQHNTQKVQTWKFLLAIVLALFSLSALANGFGVNADSTVNQQDSQNPMPTLKDGPSLAAEDNQVLLAQQSMAAASRNHPINEQIQVAQNANPSTNTISSRAGLENALPNYDQPQNNIKSSIPSPPGDNPLAQNDPIDPPPTSDPIDNSDDPPVDTTPVTPPPDQSSIGDTEVSREAFAATIRNLMPLSPDQIRALRYIFDQSQRAASTEPGSFPPKPTSSAVIVNLSPGATPPVVRLRAGFVTSLVFLDSTGEPWPIVAYDLGNPKSFNIQWDQKSNTLMVQALDSYQTGNLAVMLKDQNTPVMLTLLPGQQQVDYRVDLRVPGLGPNASAIVEDMPGAENPKLLDFLNGTPPEGSQLLRVSGVGCQAWLSNNHLYLRTRLTVLSPGWLATMSSPDGTHVYQLVKTPVVLASSRGKIIQLRIEGL